MGQMIAPSMRTCTWLCVISNGHIRYCRPAGKYTVPPPFTADASSAFTIASYTADDHGACGKKSM
jgi:hypothetical protein